MPEPDPDDLFANLGNLGNLEEIIADGMETVSHLIRSMAQSRAHDEFITGIIHLAKMLDHFTALRIMLRPIMVDDPIEQTARQMKEVLPDQIRQMFFAVLAIMMEPIDEGIDQERKLGWALTADHEDAIEEVVRAIIHDRVHGIELALRQMHLKEN